MPSPKNILALALCEVLLSFLGARGQQTTEPVGTQGDLTIEQQAFDPDPIWVNEETYVNFTVKATPPENHPDAFVSHQKYTITLNDSGDGESHGGRITGVEAGSLWFTISSDGKTATYDEEGDSDVPEEIGITVMFGGTGENNIGIDGTVTFSNGNEADGGDDGDCTVVSCSFSPSTLHVDVGEEKSMEAIIQPSGNTDVQIQMDSGSASFSSSDPPTLMIHGDRPGQTHVYATLSGGSRRGPNEATVIVHSLTPT